MRQTLTSKSIKNSVISLVYYFINLVLQFISRKVFLDYLGTEILGLNTTLTNFLQFLNLAEMGICSAISFTLYKPIQNNDIDSINEIISLQGWLYRKIAFIILLGAIVISLFFPLIFEKSDLPLWYAYCSFLVLLLSALLGYFINYKQILLTADLKNYKIQYSVQSVKILKIIFQIFALRFFHNPYAWWVLLELIFSIISSISLEYVTRKTYPFLEPNLKLGKCYYNKYPNVVKKTKQLFFHKFASFALNQTSPIIIYAYASLTMVALYGNYLMIITGVTLLMTSMFDSIHAGVGNLVARDNTDRSIQVFKELFCIRFILALTICFLVYTFASDFISLWIGPEYLLDSSILSIMVVTLFIGISRQTVDAYIYAYGLFQDIWAPLVEAALNISLSLILGYLYGISGILTGVLVSLLLIVVIWKPILLFKSGFRISIKLYLKMYTILLIYGVLTWFISSEVIGNIAAKNLTVSSFIMNIIIAFAFFIILLSIMVLFTFKSLRYRISTILFSIKK